MKTRSWVVWVGTSVLWSGAAQAESGWTRALRDSSADHLTVEVWMTAEGVAPDDASVLSGASDAAGERSLRWQALSGREILSPLVSRGPGEVCARLVGRDPIPGVRDVVVKIAAADAPAREPEVLLVSSRDGDAERALAVLRPGEQVTTVTATDAGGQVQAEYLELVSAAGRLALAREGEGAMTCYIPLNPPTM